ncbi:hypothetical protein GH714_036330 [Hevea brasiliensis]|uniref:Uncharacterized protein n=1 Tax=Hevea brasiliensis TaxID=3981 RepID=A0A6A6K891_HEVBR|nr:hypothetical protein GH714_036330 [Hevea brasiliensis]
MTKSGRYYPDPPMEKDNVRGKAKVLAEEDTDEEDDQFLRQLKGLRLAAYDDSKRNVIGVFKTMVKNLVPSLRWSPLYTPPKDQDPAPRWYNHCQC